MLNRKTILSTAVVAAMGGVSFSASAALTSSTTLDFSLGTSQVVACTYGSAPPCAMMVYQITDIVGSYFSMDTNKDGIVASTEKTPIASFNGLHIGSAQGASGSHSNTINGSEAPNIDQAWNFFGNTGMHQTTSPTTASAIVAGAGTINWSWEVTWNGIPSIPLVASGATTIACDNASCSDTSNYTIDGAFHVAGAGFTSVGYTVHLTGAVAEPSAIPVPAAAWLFGSGLVGLAGIARRRKSKA